MKKQFLESKFGKELVSMITEWDQALEKNSRSGEDKDILRTLAWCQAQWEVYRMAIKHFYGVEYHFTRTDEYYGLCTEDESDWLLRVKRVKLFQMETVFSRQRVTRIGIRIDGVEYWDDDFVHLNLGRMIIAECTQWCIRVYTEAGALLHVFYRKQEENWKYEITTEVMQEAIRRTREMQRIAREYKPNIPDQPETDVMGLVLGRAAELGKITL
nr:MAG TPA_asm: hypothetical protein [Caudoviricetes sp.]